MNLLRYGLAAVLAGMSAPAAALTVDCGKLLDVKAGRWRDHVRVTVDAGKFGAIGPQTSTPADVDLNGLACLPGLIDMHVHLTDQIKDQGATFRDLVQRNLWDQAYE